MGRQKFQGMNKIYFIFAILLLSLISFISATVSISPSSNYINVLAGNNAQAYFTISSDQNNSEAWAISDDTTYHWLNFSQWTGTVNNSNPINLTASINVPSNIISGTYVLSPKIGNNPFYITLNVSSTQQNQTQQVYSPIIIFPTSMQISVQQGQTQNENVQIVIPQNYPSSITIQSVSLNPSTNIVTFGNLLLGTIQPGSTLNIPIIISGNASVGSYPNTQLSILATNSSGQVSLPNVNIGVSVTIGTNLNTNFTQPTCVLSSSSFAINSTANTFICTGVMNNLDITIPYNPLIQGLSANYNNAGQYTYTFEATQLGYGTFQGTFSYLGSTLFNAFQQNFSVTSNGNSTISGNTINLSFSPSLSVLNNSLIPQVFVVQCLDNTSGNLIQGCSLYLNGILTNNTLTFQPGQNYTLRGTVQGYNDIVQNIYFNPQQISMQVSSPLVENQQIYVNVTPSDSSLYLDGNLINVTNGTAVFTATSGQHNLQSSDSGYINATQNITVLSALSILSNSTWQTGIQQVITLNRDANWTVMYSKDSTSQSNPIFTGVGSRVVFTPQNVGLYQIQANGLDVGDYQIPQSGFVKFISDYWIVLLILVIIVIVIIVVAKRKGGGGSWMPSSSGYGQDILSPA